MKNKRVNVSLLAFMKFKLRKKYNKIFFYLIE